MTRTEFQPAKLGAFVIGSFLLVVLAFILWGPLSGLMEKKYVIFFDETATGLDPGSAVRLNGVTIGKVDTIGLYWDPRQTNRVYTAVVVQLDPAKVKSISKGGRSFDDLLASREISGQLGISGIVSFTLEVDLKFEPQPLLPGEYRAWRQSDYSQYYGQNPWIPARQSTIAKVMEKLNVVLNNEVIPNLISSVGTMMDTNNPNGLIFKTSMALDRFNALAATLNTTVASNSNDLKTTFRNLAGLSSGAEPKLDTALSNFNAACASARANLDKFGAGVDFITNSLPGILTNLQEVSAQLDVVARGAATLPPQAMETMRSLQDTIQSLQRLIDYLERHPDSLLRGRAREN